MEREIEIKVKRELKGIETCTLCPLYQSRTNVVVGEGGFKKKIMLVGEAPGKNEDEQGRPFVGKAGKLLDELLSLAELSREDVYITNVVKCRPPGNRDPTLEEINACSVWLEKQLSILKPKIIITLGRHALAYFQSRYNLPRDNIKLVHGRAIKISTLMWQGILIPMYHPASALYNPSLRDVMIEDWKNLLDIIKS